MHRINDLRIRIVLHQPQQCAADILQGFAKVFPPVRRYCKYAFVFKVNFIQRFLRKNVIRFNGVRQSINDGISCDKNAVRRNVFAEQMLFRQRRRRKMQVCQSPCQAAVHFLRKRFIFVVSTQARLDMPDFYLIIIRRQCPCKRCRGIAMHKYKVRLFF